MKALVTGAGGFIGWHLVNYLKERGYFVRGVDIKTPEFEPTTADEFLKLDLRLSGNAIEAMRGNFDEVYALAADMGGMGFITTHGAQILRNNSLINLNSIEAARQCGCGRYLFTSSACIYPVHEQTFTDAWHLRENDAYPARPQESYGWEKLQSEHLCAAYREDYGVNTRVIRFFAIYGPCGAWRGGREKAPAALCRKVAEVKLGLSDHVDIWGDGEQTRTFCYIDDCVNGIYRVMQSDYAKPINIGSTELTSINDMATTIMKIAGVDCPIEHIDGPQGVRGRNADITRAREILKWQPKVNLREGLEKTYRWVEEQVRQCQV